MIEAISTQPLSRVIGAIYHVEEASDVFFSLVEILESGFGQAGESCSCLLLLQTNTVLFLPKSCNVSLKFFPPLFRPSGQMMEHMPVSVRRRSSVCESI